MTEKNLMGTHPSSSMKTLVVEIFAQEARFRSGLIMMFISDLLKRNFLFLVTKLILKSVTSSGLFWSVPTPLNTI